jgi:hypothetical protein|tara:strand:- start:382 stop:648 length:267 start_codon:yes stop_codon:yes gene_type:complete
MTNSFHEYKLALEQGECSVSFMKVSGEERTMRCTLKKSMIPNASKSDPLSQTKIRELSEKVIPCWDLDAAGWRSFRVDNVIYFRGPDG